MLAAGDPTSPRGEQALAALCEAYWYPLYAYLRGCNFSPADAQDLTQAFFERLMTHDFLSRADRERGRFHWFLLRSLQNFLRNELDRTRARKRGGSVPHVSWDALAAEQRFLAEPVDHVTPDLLFDRCWARAAITRAFDRLSEEFAAADRAPLFDHLKSFLGGREARVPYKEIASRLGISTVAVKVAVHRLRQRYKDLVRNEIAQTLADPSEVDDELRHLARLLAD